VDRNNINEIYVLYLVWLFAEENYKKIIF
jgi:hypothetical protein